MPEQHGSEAPNTTSIPLVKDIFGVSADFLGQLRTWFEQNPPSIPITQIVGFTGFTLQPAPSITTGEITNLAAYGDLATVGPTLTGLSNGQYAIFYGSQITPTAGTIGVMSVQANAVAAVDADAVAVDAAAVQVSTSRLILKTLSSGNNTLTAKYRSTAAGINARFSNRWLIAIKYAN